jgi:hypothetical protein
MLNHCKANDANKYLLDCSIHQLRLAHTLNIKPQSRSARHKL